MTTDPQLIVAVGVAIATVGLIAISARFKASRSDERLMDAIYGAERDKLDGGLVQELSTLTETIETDQQARAREHRELRTAVERNRELTIDIVRNVIVTLDDELDDADINTRDIEPEWYPPDDLTGYDPRLDDD